MKDEEINELIDKYIDGTATAKEVKLLDNWYQSFEKNPGLTAQMSTAQKQKAVTESFKSVKAKLV